MKEIKSIITAYQHAKKQNCSVALATVVHVEGSSYRKPGARMLVTEQGDLTGAISGGCLEGDALRKALLSIVQQKNKIVTYDTSNEDLTLGVQLGCNGIVHILFEYIDFQDPNNAVELLVKSFENGRKPTVCCTFFSLDSTQEQPGTILLYDNNQLYFKKSWHKELLPELFFSQLKQTQETLSSSCRQYSVENAPYYCFLEVIKPSVSLILVGAGNDAIPVANLASNLGWEITLIDGRATHANKERFPMANKIIVDSPTNAVSELQTDNRSAVVLMTHNYHYDKEMLCLLLNSPCAYIGNLGPKKKFKRMLSEMNLQGIAVNQEQLEKIFAPIGLDLGAETPEEVALSIIAEIKGVISQKKLPSLKYKETPIHERFNGNYLMPVDIQAGKAISNWKSTIEDFSCAINFDSNKI